MINTLCALHPGQHCSCYYYNQFNQARLLTTEGRLLRQYGPREDAPDCISPVFAVNYGTGEILRGAAGQVEVLQTCRSFACLRCSRSKIREVARAIALVARPTHLLTVTGMPSQDWAEIQPLITALRKNRTRDGHRFPWLFGVEPNPGDPGRAHLHAWAHGNVPDERTLGVAASRAGLGSVVQVKPVRRRTYGGMAYVLKGKTWNSDSREQFRVANGHRTVHASPGFWGQNNARRNRRMVDAVVLAKHRHWRAAG